MILQPLSHFLRKLFGFAVLKVAKANIKEPLTSPEELDGSLATAVTIFHVTGVIS